MLPYLAVGRGPTVLPTAPVVCAGKPGIFGDCSVSGGGRPDTTQSLAREPTTRTLSLPVSSNRGWGPHSPHDLAFLNHSKPVNCEQGGTIEASSLFLSL